MKFVPIAAPVALTLAAGIAVPSTGWASCSGDFSRGVRSTERANAKVPQLTAVVGQFNKIGSQSPVDTTLYCKKYLEVIELSEEIYYMFFDAYGGFVSATISCQGKKRDTAIENANNLGPRVKRMRAARDKGQTLYSRKCRWP